MAPSLQFAFLGCHNSYLASVTLVSQSGCPLDRPNIACHGLPEDFVENTRRFAETRYVYNVRGHDCFAFLGEWTKETTKGHTQASALMLAEIDALAALAKDNLAHDPPYREADLLLSLGPAPGSFFADAFRLRRYRWSNLPVDLEDNIQKEVCSHGYGRIYDVAINSVGGWVLQFDKGKTYKWGGMLPNELENALQEGRNGNVTIKQLYLNHQNAQEYVLMFKNACAYLSLHHDFQSRIRDLVESMFPKREVKWHFTAWCYCDKQLQRQANARYYNQRGRFQLRRQNFDQALNYLREAYHLDYANTDYRDDYYMALAAARKHDPIPEDQLTRFDSHNVFRNEYVFMRDKIGNIDMLEQRQSDMFRDAQLQQLPHEWAYIDITPSAIELSGDEASVGTQTFELPHRRDTLTSVRDPIARDSIISTDSSKLKRLKFWG